MAISKLCSYPAFIFMMIVGYFITGCYDVFAGTTTKNFTVSADVFNGCEIKNSNNLQLNFPPISTGNRVSYTQLQFQLNCTPGSKVNIKLSDGEHPTKNGTKQLLLSVPNTPEVYIPYKVYLVDSSGTKKAWKTISFSGDALNKPITMEADVDATGKLMPGVYRDTLVMSITY